MSGVYLCLGQGCSKLKAAFGATEASEHLAMVRAYPYPYPHPHPYPHPPPLP